jgi:hypothetical protein
MADVVQISHPDGPLMPQPLIEQMLKPRTSHLRQRMNPTSLNSRIRGGLENMTGLASDFRVG